MYVVLSGAISGLQAVGNVVAVGPAGDRSLHMNALAARFDLLWIALAINSFPVPVSPKIRTVESVGERWKDTHNQC
jgi:hypothetical protein